MMSLQDNTVVQGDGSSGRGASGLALRKVYVVRGGHRHVIRDARAFRKAGYDGLAVQIIPDAELEKLPLAEEARLTPGGELILDLDSFLGAGHYMTTHGVLRKTVEATTRTRTITVTVVAPELFAYRSIDAGRTWSGPSATRSKTGRSTGRSGHAPRTNERGRRNRPALCQRATRRATFLMRSGLPTEVPPYF